MNNSQRFDNMHSSGDPWRQSRPFDPSIRNDHAGNSRRFQQRDDPRKVFDKATKEGQGESPPRLARNSLSPSVTATVRDRQGSIIIARDIDPDQDFTEATAGGIRHTFYYSDTSSRLEREDLTRVEYVRGLGKTVTKVNRPRRKSPPLVRSLPELASFDLVSFIDQNRISKASCVTWTFEEDSLCIREASEIVAIIIAANIRKVYYDMDCAKLALMGDSAGGKTELQISIIQVVDRDQAPYRLRSLLESRIGAMHVSKGIEEIQQGEGLLAKQRLNRSKESQHSRRYRTPSPKARDHTANDGRTPPLRYDHDHRSGYTPSSSYRRRQIDETPRERDVGHCFWRGRQMQQLRLSPGGLSAGPIKKYATSGADAFDASPKPQEKAQGRQKKKPSTVVQKVSTE